MSPNRIYRFSLWLPLIVPVTLIVVMNVLFKGFGVPKPSGYLDIALETLAGSALIGGIPYIALALWARWWMRDKSEPEIRRVMFLAPVLMVAAFGLLSLIIGVSGGSGFSLWLYGASIIIPLGYAYVVLTMGLRRWLGPREVIA